MYFNYLEKADPEITAAIKREINRQETKIEMIASENFVNYEIIEAAGSALTNKYAEGYPGCAVAVRGKCKQLSPAIR